MNYIEYCQEGIKLPETTLKTPGQPDRTVKVVPPVLWRILDMVKMAGKNVVDKINTRKDGNEKNISVLFKDNSSGNIIGVGYAKYTTNSGINKHSNSNSVSFTFDFRQQKQLNIWKIVFQV